MSIHSASGNTVREPPARYHHCWLEEDSDVGAVRLSSAGNAISDIESMVEPEDADESLGLEFAPDAASLDEKYTDDSLQTGSKPEMLDKSLRRLDEQARGQ